MSTDELCQLIRNLGNQIDVLTTEIRYLKSKVKEKPAKEPTSLTIREAAAKIGCTPKTIYTYMMEGKLDYIKLSEKKTRIKAKSLEALLEFGFRKNN